MHLSCLLQTDLPGSYSQDCTLHSAPRAGLGLGPVGLAALGESPTVTSAGTREPVGRWVVPDAPEAETEEEDTE